VLGASMGPYLLTTATFNAERSTNPGFSSFNGTVVFDHGYSRIPFSTSSPTSLQRGRSLLTTDARSSMGPWSYNLRIPFPMKDIKHKDEEFNTGNMLQRSLGRPTTDRPLFWDCLGFWIGILQ
jgi:hypothetical protein